MPACHFINIFQREADIVWREQNTTYYVGLTLEYIYKVTSGHEVIKWSETLSDRKSITTTMRMPVMDVAFPRQGHGVSRDDNEW
jgi:hypothetical protein